MRTKSSMWVVLILALILIHPGCAKTAKVKSNVDQAVIGALKYEIYEAASGKILASGDGLIHLKDVVLVERPDVPRRLIDKRIKLAGEFEIAMAEFPAANYGEKTGFAITAKRIDNQSFSWEWFDIRDGNRAVKRQEFGELGIQLKKIGDGWEIARTEFRTDISLRVIQRDLDPPGSPPRWRINIFKGSSITWPSIVDRKTIPN